MNLWSQSVSLHHQWSAVYGPSSQSEQVETDAHVIKDQKWVQSQSVCTLFSSRLWSFSCAFICLRHTPAVLYSHCSTRVTQQELSGVFTQVVKRCVTASERSLCVTNLPAGCFSLNAVWGGGKKIKKSSSSCRWLCSEPENSKFKTNVCVCVCGYF